jgi:hypothetical protein
MTPGDALQGKPSASECTVLFDRLNAVLRTGGRETTTRTEQGRQGTLIETDDRDE